MSTIALMRPEMTPAAKAWLSSTIRALRQRLLKDLRDELESTYRLSIPRERAGLREDRRQQRERLETWLDEQARGATRGLKETIAQARERHLRSAEKLAAATLLNRLVVLRQMEALDLVRVKVVTGGWDSPGYREFRDLAPALLQDESEGYGTLLRLVYEELALDLPGLFGDVGVTSLVPVPSSTLRAVVEALDGDDLAQADRDSLWGDDTVLGWVYQFWNDPEREALDEKIRNRGKIENHEIAAKTQLFTDRYMVEWLLQNSLGQLWFAMCEKNGWTPEVVRNNTLDRLEERRAEWRGKRERGEVSLEALMPLESEEEERWKYWVPRELPKDGAEHAPARLRDLKLLDPACGSGHFLVIAFDLLAALYEEEARHRGESPSLAQISRWIVENNLHGIDLDPRAVQIAAAALWLKMKTYCPEAEPRRVNLVASNLGLGSLPKEDPALLELEQAVERETGIPAALTRRIVDALKGADYLGSLLKVSETIDRAIDEHERAAGLVRSAPSQGDLWKGFPPVQLVLTPEEARASLTGRLDEFLGRHTSADDLGLRLRGQQLAAGVRFLRLLREGQYHLVVGNPPYQGAGKMVDSAYLSSVYPWGKADLCTAFLTRSYEWIKKGGLSLLITIRGWLFLSQFERLRKQVWRLCSINLVGDFDQGAFSNEVGNLLSIVAVMLRRDSLSHAWAVGVLPTPLETRWRNDNRRAFRKHAALLVGEGRHNFLPERLAVVPRHPLIYWWDQEFLTLYDSFPKIGQHCESRLGLRTSDNARFLRRRAALDGRRGRARLRPQELPRALRGLQLASALSGDDTRGATAGIARAELRGQAGRRGQLLSSGRARLDRRAGAT
ncbi:MAG: BREX-6 system adenine-specific DNA-methyltransferase PglX [Armatimonadetes bacterium]|nr:BREX-6 system adenine-specific DNA-methyltransferase PglX [Armatimonadota bacterium]